MKFSKVIGILLLAVGVVLLIFGVNAANAPLEEVGEAITGRYSDETMGYLIGGIAAGIVGLVVILRSR